MENKNSLKALFKEYSGKNIYPMHMPGHKQNNKLSSDFPYAFDVTEVGGFDDLHKPDGVLKLLNENIARLFGARQSFVLVNGSTSGVLAGIRTISASGDKILIAGNCHKSVMNAIELCNLEPIIIYPEALSSPEIFGSVQPSEIRKALKSNSDIKVVVITSPTYEGVISDISEIAEAVHEKGAVLMVDEAHGSHLGFGTFPESAVKLGADLVVQSMHKTLAGMTQTAVLHVCSDRINIEFLKHNMSVFQSSSPSYVLMYSVENCLNLLENKIIMKDWYNRIITLRSDISKLKNIKLFTPENTDIYAYDPSKILLYGDFSGKDLDRLLQQDGFYIEMSHQSYALAMTGLGDTDSGLKNFASAIKRLDGEISSIKSHKEINLPPPPVQSLPINKSISMPQKLISTKHSAGYISGEYVWIYPPGMPIIYPGALITEELSEYICELEKSGENVQKTFSDSGFISVIK